MKIKQILKTIVPLATASFGLVACFGNGAPEATDNVIYGVLSESTIGITYSTTVLENYFETQTVNPGYESTDQGYISNISNLGTQFGTSAENSLIAGNPISSTVNAYAIKYNTPGVNANTQPQDTNRIVSGLVITPASGIEAKGVILFYHPTEANKNSVPSCLPASNLLLPATIPSKFSYCDQYSMPAGAKLNANRQYITTLGATFAANGYIVVAPDYIGMGNDLSAMHPYVVYPQVNAKSGIYMLSAAKTLLQNMGYTGAKFDGNTKLFITGFSEGGSYALNASQQLQTNMAGYLQNLGLHLTVTAPTEGAYDLRDSQMNFEFSNQQDGLFSGGSLKESDLVNCDEDTGICVPSEFAESINPWHVGTSLATSLTKPYLISYALTAYGNYSLGNQTAGMNQIMIPAFWTNIPYLIPNSIGGVEPSGLIYNSLQLYMIPNLLPTNYLSVIFNTRTLKNPTNSQLYAPAESSYTTLYVFGQGIPFEIPPLTATGNGGNNSAAAMVPENIRNLPMFIDTMNNASTYKWQTKSPINFINMNYDSVVTVDNFNVAYAYMSNSSNKTTTYVESTHLVNFQTANDLTQFGPYDKNTPDDSTGAISWYWGSIPSDIIKASKDMFSNEYMGMPVDHTTGNGFWAIAALSVFDSYTRPPVLHKTQQTTLKSNSAQTKAKFNERIAKWKATHKQ